MFGKAYSVMKLPATTQILVAKGAQYTAWGSHYFGWTKKHPNIIGFMMMIPGSMLIISLIGGSGNSPFSGRERSLVVFRDDAEKVSCCELRAYMEKYYIQELHDSHVSTRVLRSIMDHIIEKNNSFFGNRIKKPELFVTTRFGTNCSTTPFGIIHISSGALSAVSTPSELAALICHELAHHMNDHPFELLSAESGWRSFATVLQMIPGLSATFGWVRTTIINYTFGIASKTLSVDQTYSKIMECEADLLAVNLMANAGFDPMALCDVPLLLSGEKRSSFDVAQARRLLTALGLVPVAGEDRDFFQFPEHLEIAGLAIPNINPDSTEVDLNVGAMCRHSMAIDTADFSLEIIGRISVMNATLDRMHEWAKKKAQIREERRQILQRLGEEEGLRILEKEQNYVPMSVRVSRLLSIFSQGLRKSFSENVRLRATMDYSDDEFEEFDFISLWSEGLEEEWEGIQQFTNENQADCDDIEGTTRNPKALQQVASCSIVQYPTWNGNFINDEKRQILLGAVLLEEADHKKLDLDAEGWCQADPYRNPFAKMLTIDYNDANFTRKILEKAEEDEFLASLKKRIRNRHELLNLTRLEEHRKLFPDAPLQKDLILSRNRRDQLDEKFTLRRFFDEIEVFITSLLADKDSSSIHEDHLFLKSDHDENQLSWNAMDMNKWTLNHRVLDWKAIHNWETEGRRARMVKTHCILVGLRKALESGTISERNILSLMQENNAGREILEILNSEKWSINTQKIRLHDDGREEEDEEVVDTISLQKESEILEYDFEFSSPVAMAIPSELSAAPLIEVLNERRRRAEEKVEVGSCYEKEKLKVERLMNLLVKADPIRRRALEEWARYGGCDEDLNEKFQNDVLRVKRNAEKFVVDCVVNQLKPRKTFRD
eukprot:GDKK01039653.1.p1 GENE.GDKK01039653.1~~GDKK01039653.1.p1  ORF type:complete len:944 (-),score=175.50 GDKK01039653.1:288-2954(-)